MGETEEHFTQVLQLLETLKVDHDKLRKENTALREQVKNLCKRPDKQNTRTSMTVSKLAMVDVTRMAQDPSVQNIAEAEDEDGTDEDRSDGLALSASTAVDPTKSSYATGYDYNLLKSSEVLVVMHDVGVANQDIDDSAGMWVNYILALERNSTLKVVNKKKLIAEGKYYHVKSITEGLPIEKLIAYCKSRGVRGIAPCSVSDEIYLSRNIKTLQDHDIWPFCCEDPQSYITLDHKWLSYLFCKEQGIAQAETIPVRVDTVDACRALVERITGDGKPCFLKECFDTVGGDGVIKIDKLEDYDDAVLRLSKGKGPQPADTIGVDQHIVIQAGHPGRICTSHNIFYKGTHVSQYTTKENADNIDRLGDLRLDMALGSWSPNKDDLTLSFKLDLDDPSDRNVRDQAITTMKQVGKALNYTGMLEVEFIIAEEPDAVINVLEFNPRFSGACHAYVGSGMVQDYMHILSLIASTKGDTDSVMKVASTFHVRSDAHVPKANFKDYNCPKFYLKQPGTIFKLRNYEIGNSVSLRPFSSHF